MCTPGVLPPEMCVFLGYYRGFYRGHYRGSAIFNRNACAPCSYVFLGTESKRSSKKTDLHSSNPPSLSLSPTLSLLEAPCLATEVIKLELLLLLLRKYPSPSPSRCYTHTHTHSHGLQCHVLQVHGTLSRCTRTHLCHILAIRKVHCKSTHTRTHYALYAQSKCASCFNLQVVGRYRDAHAR